jgi:hypothetical protein
MVIGAFLGSGEMFTVSQRLAHKTLNFRATSLNVWSTFVISLAPPRDVFELSVALLPKTLSFC